MIILSPDGFDYTGVASESLSFVAGSVSGAVMNLSVIILNDNRVENDEQFELVLTSPDPTIADIDPTADVATVTIGDSTGG